MMTMKAARIHDFGGPDGLIYEDAPRPALKAGEVLIKVVAAGINPIDWKIGEMPGHPALPLIPGWEVAGMVEILGPGVSALTAGEAVFAMADLQQDGAYAEYIAVSAALLCPKPSSIDFITAAAIPLAGTTAWEALTEQANLTSGQTILIHGGAGSVGAFAVQFAKIKGAKVIATASGADLDYVRELGADVVVDYKTAKFEDAARDVDVVLDTVGGDTQARSWQTLRGGGILVTTVGITTDSPQAAARGVQGRAFGARPDGTALAEIARLVGAGQVKPRIASTYPLSNARQAQELARSRQAHGKVMLEV